MTLNRKTSNEEGWTIDERLKGETFLDAANRLKRERSEDERPGDAQSDDAYDPALPVPVDRTHRTPCVEGSVCGIPEAHCPPA